MSDTISASNCTHFASQIKLAWQYYQQLLEAAAIAASDNPRKSWLATLQPQAATFILGKLQLVGPSETKKVNEYRQDKQQPNVHISVYYKVLMTKYRLPSNCNVLIGKDKHRWFKKIIYNTNFSNIEHFLLTRESVQQIAQLIFFDAYQLSEPQLTATFKSLYDTCPALFESLLPRSEQLELQTEDDEPYQSIMADANHLQPRVLSWLKPMYCRDKLNFPICSSALPVNFRQNLWKVYTDDYSFPNITHFGTGKLLWYKKIRFLDKDTE